MTEYGGFHTRVISKITDMDLVIDIDIERHIDIYICMVIYV